MTNFEHYAWITSYVGLAVTIFAAVMAKRASQAAQEAKSRVFFLDTVDELSKAIATIAEIERHQRTEALEILPDRYKTTLSHLMLVKTGKCVTSEEEKIIIAVCAQLRTAKNMIERALVGDEKLNIPKQNKILTNQSVELESILSRIKKES